MLCGVLINVLEMISYYILNYEVRDMKKAIVYTYLLFIVILSIILYLSHELEMLLGLCFGTSFIAWFLCFIVDFVNDENLLYKEEKKKISQELDENIKT
jgi:hypothetical protein